MTRPKKLSLVVPFYNEKNIAKNTRTLLAFLKKNIPDYELILVDDGSTQNYLLALTDSLKRNPRLKLITIKRNLGRGFSVKMGFRKASGDYLAYIDADLEIPPKYLSGIYRALPIMTLSLPVNITLNRQ